MMPMTAEIVSQRYDTLCFINLQQLLQIDET